MDKDIDIHELINKHLDLQYRRAFGKQLLQIRSLSTNPGSDMVQSLNELDQEAQGLTESGQPISMDNKKLKTALNAFGAVLAVTGTLIVRNAQAVQDSGVNIAPQAFTARVFLNLTEEIIAKGLDPLSAKAMSRYQTAIQNAGGRFTIPSPRLLSTYKAIDFIHNPEWKAKMEGWGSGYYRKTMGVFEQGMYRGWSPKYTAEKLREVAANIPYSAAENLTRTLQLNAYRQSSLEMERLNGGFITGKIRIATLDQRTCLVPNTLIDTISGGKPIQDIRVGDLVKTHKGTYEKVADVMSKDYSRQTVNIKTKDGHLECTDDHPILVLREGYCHWVLAKDIQSGDSIFIASENGSYNLDHISGDISVKWSVGNPDDIVSIGVQSDNLPCVGVGTLGVPINAVNFEGNVQAWDKEVNGIPVYLGLLLKYYSKLFKAQSDILLWFALASVLMITAWTTKLFTFGIFAGAKSVFLTAIQALIHKDWTPANLRAIYSFVFTGGIKFFATSFADEFPTLHIFPLAVYGTIMIAICIGLWNSKLFSATHAGFTNSSMLKSAFLRAVIKICPLFKFTWSELKFFSTSLAGKLLPISFLPDGSTFHRAAHPASRTFDLGSQNSKFFSANSTSKVGKFSAHVVLSSNLSNRNYNGKVYNLEVENEHTYLANGFVVHNCLSCIALHGTPIPLGEAVEDHYRGRCTEFYQVPGGDEFPAQMQVDSTPGNRRFQKFQTGEEWFASLPPERQAQQASFLNSPAKLRAYRDGTPLSAFVGNHVDPVFGNQKIEKSLLQTLGGGANNYYTPRIPKSPLSPSTSGTFASIHDYESSIANNNFESAGVYSSDGKLLFTKKGDKTSVQFTVDELNQMNGATVTHNHPDGSSFSRDDIRMFLNEKIKEIRAVGNEFTYSMVNDNSVELTSRAFDRVFRRSLVQSVEDNPGASDKEIIAHAWSLFSEETGLTYTRTPR